MEGSRDNQFRLNRGTFDRFGTFAGGETRTPTPLLAADFESAASTNSATPARFVSWTITRFINPMQSVARAGKNVHNTGMRIRRDTSILHTFKNIAAAVILLISIPSCRSTPESPEALDALAGIENAPPLIDLALQRIGQVSDADSRLFILTNAASSLVNQDDPDLAEDILDIALAFVRENYSGPRFIEVLVEVSDAYTNTGVISKSVVLLEEALTLARSGTGGEQNGRLVQEIIISCFSIGSDALDLLRLAVQQIYIIESYELRAELLLDTARRYQEAGEAQRSANLLQQAIPAAGSIPPGLARARAFAFLGLRLGNAGEQRLSGIYSEKAVEELAGFSAQDNDRVGGSEAADQQLSDILITLARTGRAADALLYNGLIDNPRLRLGALLETARSFYAAGQFLQADLAFERIFTALERNSPPSLVISILLGISQIYLDFSDTFSAQVYVDATSIYFDQIEDAVEKDSLLLETALMYGRIGDLAAGEALAREISDGFFAARALTGLAEYLIEEETSGNGASEIENGSRIAGYLEESDVPSAGGRFFGGCRLWRHCPAVYTHRTSRRSPGGDPPHRIGIPCGPFPCEAAVLRQPGRRTLCRGDSALGVY
jgi:tetratricopeptide (TPR) repeat protein